MNLDEMKALYTRVMGPSPELDAATSFTVRIWDGMDGVWCDVITDVDFAFALREWCAKTANGTHHVSFNQIDYYRIFPGGTHMLWSGNNTMFPDR